ncbi:MAG: hypothetical protein KGQ41_04785 [Alphaproteobacteria bacterium]|nr:hypothetical protein [Alphaproteobacteria bacterium]
MYLHRFIVLFLALSTGLYAIEARADCASASDRACVAAKIIADADATKEDPWRDQILRDVAASLTYDDKIDQAIGLIAKIKNPDTKAMTIRAIGMAAALYGKQNQDQLRAVFEKLAKVAVTIPQPDANAIAFTYIAMSQAFAGMDEDAWATSAKMTNAALRFKAYGETAEIQAERGDLAAAMKSVGFIQSSAFRNKAHANVAGILIKKDMFDEALKAALAIDNPTKRAEVLQSILKAQEDKTRGTRKDVASEAPKDDLTP